ncbi:muellerian-inhibiting factor [Sceloporus undulatus]|uniref:muellerian-inhibiting factor n=1 Tax=Sceloporus undulatus TaxID=8520 RepID=UPI001C4B5687|nr:muellerian-inhibiting factor [Sceloporus undulatus]XP_042335858.1 muellerian-inhibiting factor [Sceloporus undulatus]
MQVAAGGLLLALLLVLEAISIPENENFSEGLRTEPEVSNLRRSETPEEDEILTASDITGPRSQVSLAVVNLQDHRGGHVQPGQNFAGGEALGLWARASFQPWPQGVPEEPVCRVKLDRGSLWAPNHLEVVGLLTSYDSGFLKALSRSAWSQEELETFGLCPTENPRSLLSSLRRVGESLADPGESRFLLLHLEEVKWEAETKLRFKVVFQEDIEESLGPLQHALLVFYQGGREGEAMPLEKFLVGGEGLHQEQEVCLSRRTQFLVLQGSEILGRPGPGHLSFDLSLEIRRQSSEGAALSSQEAQDLLFGFDPKCFTRMTPMVLLLVKQRPGDAPLPAPSSFLAASGKLDTVPYLKPSRLPAFGVAEVPPSDSGATNLTNISVPEPTSTGRFLEALSRFVNKVLSPSGDPPSVSRVHLRLDFDTMEALPHLRLNLSEKVALEQLVQSEDHLVVLFPEDSQALMEEHVGHWYLEGSLLQQLLEKLRLVIRELKSLPSFQANADLFHTLLGFCYYPSGGLGTLSHGNSRQVEGPRGREKIHSLLLLKALQAVRARWRESKKASSRANRSARNQDDYCQLRELQIDLVSTGYIILPESYNANNCVGPCRSPLSTRISNYYSHTIFLLRMHEQGMPLDRAPCCVPVKYSQSHMVTFTNDQGLMVKVYPDMVAKSCGCR